MSNCVVAKNKSASKTKSNPETIRRVILGELNRVFRDRWGPEFPDSAEGRDDLQVLLHFHALHPTHGREKMRHTIETRASWMKQDEVDLIVGDILILDPRRLRLSSNELRERIWLSNVERERLRAWHIPPFDMTAEQLAKHRKSKKNANRRLKRKLQPRSIYLFKSKSRLKPWEIEGVGRSTWYRRRKACETGMAPVLRGQICNSECTTPSHVSRPRPCETSPSPAYKVLEEPHLSHPKKESQKGEHHG